MNNVIKQIIEKAKSENRNLLTEIEAKQVFKEAGLQVTDTRLATNKKDAIAMSTEMGFPVVLKIVSPDILHKTEANGVKLNLKTADDVAKAFDEIMVSAKEKFPNANIHGVAVQGMAKSGLEIIIGMTLDTQFGPVLMFGLGGIFVEVMKDVSFGITPLMKRDERIPRRAKDRCGQSGVLAVKTFGLCANISRGKRVRLEPDFCLCAGSDGRRRQDNPEIEFSQSLLHFLFSVNPYHYQDVCPFHKYFAKSRINSLRLSNRGCSNS